MFLILTHTLSKTITDKIGSKNTNQPLCSSTISLFCKLDSVHIRFSFFAFNGTNIRKVTQR